MREVSGTHRNVKYCRHSLRHPVAPMLALRDRSGAHRRFLVVCGALSAVTGKAPGTREAAEARSRAVSRRSSRKPGFVVRGGRSRDTRPRTADLGSGDRGHGPMLSPDPYKSLAPPRVGIPGIPELSRIIPGTKLLIDRSRFARAWMIGPPRKSLGPTGSGIHPSRWTPDRSLVRT